MAKFTIIRSLFQPPPPPLPIDRRVLLLSRHSSSIHTNTSLTIKRAFLLDALGQSRLWGGTERSSACFRNRTPQTEGDRGLVWLKDNGQWMAWEEGGFLTCLRPLAVLHRFFYTAPCCVPIQFITSLRAVIRTIYHNNIPRLAYHLV